MSAQKTITVILPATDETYSLTETMEQVRAKLPTYTLHFLVVMSPKFTTLECRDTVRALQEKYPGCIEAFDQTKPRLGGAIQEAFARAQGEYTALMSSDLETDPVALPAMIAALENGADIAATTRWKGGAGFKGYNPIKLILNYVFQLTFRILYLTNLTDLTYGYRAYKTEILKRIRWEETKFSFLFECIVKPLRLGYKAVEIAVPWRARTEGKSHASAGEILDYARLGLKVRFMPKARMLYPVR